MKTKTGIILLGVCAAIAAAVIAVAVMFALSRTTEIRIPDPTSPWQHTFRHPLPLLGNGNLAVLVNGEIEGTATLTAGGTTFSLSSGKVNMISISPEAWEKECIISYTPTSVTNANLTVRVAIGSSPKWVRRPLLDAIPVAYVGGWTTWHPNREQIYSKGFYFRGQKKGSWSYWNEQGQLIKTEEWKDGKLIETANK